MERLTDKKVGNSYPLKENVSSKFGLFNDYGGLYAHFFAVNRLGEIEDILGEEYSLEKLKEMVDAEKDGRCVVLPVKINSCVWFIKSAFSMAHFPIKANHVSFRGLSTDGDIWYSAITENNGISRSFYGSDLNKTVFLTREEAEKALEGMEV